MKKMLVSLSAFIIMLILSSAVIYSYEASDDTDLYNATIAYETYFIQGDSFAFFEDFSNFMDELSPYLQSIPAHIVSQDGPLVPQAIMQQMEDMDVSISVKWEYVDFPDREPVNFVLNTAGMLEMIE